MTNDLKTMFRPWQLLDAAGIERARLIAAEMQQDTECEGDQMVGRLIAALLNEVVLRRAGYSLEEE